MQATRLNQEDGFDMEEITAHNTERRLRQIQRRGQRALNRARLVMGPELDEVEWWANRQKRRGNGQGGCDTTVSPTSDDCDDECTSSECSSESHDDIDASSDAWLSDKKR